MTFELYQASSGGSPLWTENMSTNLSATNGVSVVNGIFDVLLGSNSSLGSVNFTAPLWLQIKVGGNSLETLSPRMPLASAPYAFAATRLYANVSVNENVAYIAKTGTGAGNLINLSNSGTGFDIEAQSFTLKNGVLISLNTTTAGFRGNGSGLFDLDAGKISNGSLAVGRLSSTGLYYFNGSVLYDLDASKLANGTVAAARLTGSGYTFNASALTALDASALANGTVAAARLTGAYTGVTGLGTLTALVVSGVVTGNGSALTALDASALANGTLADGRLSGTYTGALTLSSTSNVFTGSATSPAFRGNGSA
ncbi:hypothetical protein HZC09_03365, partial [Candidatus Micrarchaeota archaeon]|nr:hypothetical protein [Candidatus Micrarchaeota archaeon]